MIVSFRDVGRNHLHWEADLPEISEAAIVGEVIRRKALISRGIDADLENGRIIVGGFRVAGRFFVKPAAVAAESE